MSKTELEKYLEDPAAYVARERDEFERRYREELERYHQVYDQTLKEYGRRIAGKVNDG